MEWGNAVVKVRCAVAAGLQHAQIIASYKISQAFRNRVYPSNQQSAIHDSGALHSCAIAL